MSSITVPASMDWPLYRGQNLEADKRMMEQRCFYSYSRRVDESDVFEYWVPEGFYKNAVSMGFENPWLMYIIIGLGATIQAAMQSPEPSLLATVHAYTGRSIAGQLSKIKSGVDDSNFHALYTTANLIACQTILYRRVVPRERSSLAGIVDWLRCWRGVRSLLKVTTVSIPRSQYTSDLAGRSVDKQFIGALLDSSDSNHVFSFLLRYLPRISTPYQTTAAYRYVVGFLSMLYHKPVRLLHSEFLVHAPATFAKSVASCEPTALLLMGTYFALSRILDTPFISDETSEMELRLLLTFLPRLHTTLLERAITVIGQKDNGTI
ncbi:hypothetical protein GQ53DRAFT_842790 [Thozetella sp. PMI_491]|nr:hypothetical protein GQ53DRAFT_842790 [Thozetella sp. PMI_491]